MQSDFALVKRCAMSFGLQSGSGMAEVCQFAHAICGSVVKG